ncbi:hypothetical protein MYAM1_000402 [Malassezia yamatoensis]|uniref:Uncharacterized protein n=1 Tax=Malassezia yamatoensis TaxID=253288 RepID=A0AAJ5YNQ2_9BASI|nr:hypothetical protein MYAM1_000402 [Malassezia yamatoensis]
MSDKVSRGAVSDAQAASPFRTLQSCVGKPVKVRVSYNSFQAPEYGKATQHISGRVWAYDEKLDLVVLETASQGEVPSALRRAAAGAACNVHSRNASLKRSGFKVLRGSLIEHADEVDDNRSRSNLINAPLSRVNRVSHSAMDIRETAGTKRSLERAQQIGPKEAGDAGQAVFDALSKTYQSGPTYDGNTTYVPDLSKEQIEQLLSGKEDTSKVERAQAKANTWQRVTKVLEGVRQKLDLP